jgi:hypothetical protein
MILLAGLLNGCGSDNSLADGPDNQGTDAAAAIIELILSNTQLGTALTALPVTITAQVKDASNAVVPGALVAFSASSGSITITQATTDASGIALAELRNGSDPSNRIITVTVTSGGASATVDVLVTGTSLSFVSGPGSLPQGDTEEYIVALTDSDNNGISGQTVTLSSALGNSINAATVITDNSGQVAFDYTADNAGSDLLGAGALGESAGQAVEISDDAFTLEIAGMLTEIPLNTPTDVTVTWVAGGAPVVGGDVAFASTAGAITEQAPPDDVTDGAGQQTFSIESASAGPVLITATGQPAGPTTSVSAEFVATLPANLELQAEPLTVATGDQSTLTATVTDANSNPVKNTTVNFTRLQDPSAGSLSSPTGVTDVQGRATAVYTAGQTPTGQDDVIIEATVQGTAILAQETLTVARKELFISLGTGNDLFEPNTAQFRKEWVVQVTDADGNAVSGVAVQVSLNSLRWFQGCYYVPEDAWVRVVTAECLDEDINRNGVLDVVPTVLVDEDTNMNGRIEAGNIALVSAQGGIPGQAANVITDATGSALVDVLYPQSYHGWVEVEIEAKASVAGTETRRSQTFVLDAKAEDITNTSASPPGVLSPFGENSWDLGPNIDLTQNGCLSAPEDPDPVPDLCPPPPIVVP